MPGFIVPPPGQQTQPVIRRVVALAKQHGENVQIDKNMPTMRLLVGDKTLAAWHESNRSRHARDAKAAANAAEAAAERKRERERASREAAEAAQEPKSELRRPAAKKQARKRNTTKRGA